MEEQCRDIADSINPIALRKAKIVCNFGLSECNRVKGCALLVCTSLNCKINLEF